MASIDAVIQALRDYSGTLIFREPRPALHTGIGQTNNTDRGWARLQILRVIMITTYGSQGSNDAQSGLIEGLRDARPDQEKDLNTGEKALSAKEKRRMRSQERERKKAERGKT